MVNKKAQERKMTLYIILSLLALGFVLMFLWNLGIIHKLDILIPGFDFDDGDGEEEKECLYKVAVLQDGNRIGFCGNEECLNVDKSDLYLEKGNLIVKSIAHQSEQTIGILGEDGILIDNKIMELDGYVWMRLEEFLPSYDNLINLEDSELVYDVLFCRNERAVVEAPEGFREGVYAEIMVDGHRRKIIRGGDTELFIDIYDRIYFDIYKEIFVGEVVEHKIEIVDDYLDGSLPNNGITKMKRIFILDDLNGAIIIGNKIFKEERNE